MLTYYINRGGKGLSPTRRRVLERAKSLMVRRLRGSDHGRHDDQLVAALRNASRRFARARAAIAAPDNYFPFSMNSLRCFAQVSADDCCPRASWVPNNNAPWLLLWNRLLSATGVTVATGAAATWPA
jgi:hypothetical protein